MSYDFGPFGPHAWFNPSYQQNQGIRPRDAGSRTHNASELGQRYGYYPGTVTASDPDQTMSQILRGQNRFRNMLYNPLEQNLISSLGDGKIVETARDAAAQAMGGTATRAKRMASRYGGLSGLQQSELDRKAKLGDATATAGLINEARLDQNQRDTDVRKTLINYYRGVQGNAISGMGSAANQQVQRQNALSQARSQHKANTMGMVGSLGSMALMLAFM